jgi:hypothetical protein
VRGLVYSEVHYGVTAYNIINQARNVCRVLRQRQKKESTCIQDENSPDFYAELYRRKIVEDSVLPKECDTFLQSNVDKSLPDDFCSLCNQPVSLAELDIALRKLPKGKVPGIDGLPAEFFRLFWNDLKDSFMDLVRDSFTFGNLPDK